MDCWYNLYVLECCTLVSSMLCRYSSLKLAIKGASFLHPQQKTFAASMRSKARMSLRGTPERENGGVSGSRELPVAKSMSTVPIARSSAVSLVWGKPNNLVTHGTYHTHITPPNLPQYPSACRTLLITNPRSDMSPVRNDTIFTVLICICIFLYTRDNWVSHHQ